MRLEGAFNHTLKEIGILNIIKSLRKGKFKKLQEAHDSIHEFIYLAPICCPKQANWHSKSAFLTYHWEAFHLAHRAFLEALSGYYNAAYILLRGTLELLLKGAFWECLAHKKFRDKADVIKKCRVKRKTLLDWFEDIFKLKPSIEEEFEKISVSIFDKISPITKDSELKKLIPFPKKIIEQLSEWNIFDPIPNPIDEVYKVYNILSADVHVIPDKTDIGRRLLKGKEIFETIILSEELNKFSELLKKVMDIDIVIELNILEDWIKKDKSVKEKLKNRLLIIERDLELNYATLKIKKLIKD
jgi:hypothetical protein